MREVRTVQGLLRLTVGRDAREVLPEATVKPLLRAISHAGLDAVDLPGLRTTLDALARDVRATFVRHIGEVKG